MNFMLIILKRRKIEVGNTAQSSKAASLPSKTPFHIDRINPLFYQPGLLLLKHNRLELIIENLELVILTCFGNGNTLQEKQNIITHYEMLWPMIKIKTSTRKLRKCKQTQHKLQSFCKEKVDSPLKSRHYSDLLYDIAFGLEILSTVL